MYRVFFNNRVIPSLKFPTYEQARSWVRKALRKKEHFRTPSGTNPIMLLSPYGIRKVN